MTSQLGHCSHLGKRTATRRRLSGSSSFLRSSVTGGVLKPFTPSFFCKRVSRMTCGWAKPAGGKERSHSSSPAAIPETAPPPPESPLPSQDQMSRQLHYAADPEGHSSCVSSFTLRAGAILKGVPASTVRMELRVGQAAPVSRPAARRAAARSAL